MDLKKEFYNVFRKHSKAGVNSKQKYAFILLGASGDLAKKEIYPSLWLLYKEGLLPENIIFIGYARSKLDIGVYLREKVIDRMKFDSPDEQKSQLFEQFVARNFYMSGQYDQERDFEQLNEMILDKTGQILNHDEDANRIFYFAIPPSVFKPVSFNINKYCRAKEPCFTRIVIEKPFGRDLYSSRELSAHLSLYFREEEIFRMDHYLGKEMVQSLIVLRFANQVFKRIWNSDSIESVLISFKETIGVEARGGYFDEHGIIRDVIQNHLLQVLTLITMEQPVSQTADDIRDEKVKLLRCIKEVKLENTVLGQYVKNDTGTSEQQIGYVEDETVKNDSKTATFATVVLEIKNERWDSVPFIISAGKAMDEQIAEVRIKFKETSGGLFEHLCPCNELVIRIQPDEAIYMKVLTKRPGIDMRPEGKDLDLTYREKYKDIYFPEAYERLLMDVFLGNQTNFVRNDELDQAWRIFTPLLYEIENKNIKPILYKFGSHSIPESDDLCETVGKFSFSCQS